MPALDLTGRVALVTGGSCGIGLAIVRLLVREGVRQVVVTGRDPTKLAAVVEELGKSVVTVCSDLSDAISTDRLVGELSHLAPDLSLLINNAGSQILIDLTAPDAAVLAPALRAEIAANFAAVVALSVGLLPLLRRQPSAAILNVTSGLALAPKTSSPVYCSTKAGVRSFSRSLRYQCEASLPHVRVIEALPPIVDTQMTAGRGRGKISAEACAAEIVAGVQLGRTEIYVGKTKLLRAVMRIAPALGYRIMRRG